MLRENKNWGLLGTIDSKNIPESIKTDNYNFEQQNTNDKLLFSSGEDTIMFYKDTKKRTRHLVFYTNYYSTKIKKFSNKRNMPICIEKFN